jgi:hypothetical protein
MKIRSFWYFLVVTSVIVIICLNNVVSQQRAPINFIFDHQDPAGDVLIFNATLNGTPIADPELEGLDFKWVYSEKDTIGNVILKMDLKSKNKFINEDETKYVFRILTTQDNSTGYNITYQNRTTILNSFTSSGNGTSVDISENVSFMRDKGDELMAVTVSISKYLTNISYFNLDAYSMKTTRNATYLDYISELPGHPEYVNPEVQEGENLEPDMIDDGKDTEESETPFVLFLIIPIIAVVLVVVVLLIWFSRKKRL